MGQSANRENANPSPAHRDEVEDPNMLRSRVDIMNHPWGIGGCPPSAQPFYRKFCGIAQFLISDHEGS